MLLISLNYQQYFNGITETTMNYNSCQVF